MKIKSEALFNFFISTAQKPESLRFWNLKLPYYWKTFFSLVGLGPNPIKINFPSISFIVLSINVILKFSIPTQCTLPQMRHYKLIYYLLHHSYSNIDVKDFCLIFDQIFQIFCPMKTLYKNF